MSTWKEYAAAERGYEHLADWVDAYGRAEFENRQNVRAGLNSRIIERDVTISDWREAAPR